MSSAIRMSPRTDLTKGPITQKLIGFALPIIAGNIIMQLYNVADSIIVGNFVGSDALAAVAVSFPIMMLFNALFMGLSMGANILISQYRGAGDHEATERAINTTFTLCLVIGFCVSMTGLVASRPLLHLLGTPDNILNDSAMYLMIVFIGTTGNVFFALGNGLLRGLGDARWPLYSLIISSVLNILLDLLFVIVFGWGVPGVAIATMLSHFVSGMILLSRFITGKYGFRLTLTGMRNVDKAIIKIIFRLGIPTSIQNGAMSLGMVIIQSLANNFGSNYIAAQGIIQRVDGFVMMPFMGLGMAVTTFVGQNIGAGDIERAKRGAHISLLIVSGLSLLMGVVMYNFGFYLMRAFTDNVPVLEMGYNGIRFIAFFYICMGINATAGGAIRGAGEANYPAVVAILGSLIRIPLAYFMAVLPLLHSVEEAVSAGLYATAELARAAGAGLEHYMGLFHAMGISMAFGGALIMIYFISGKWQNKGLVQRRAPK
ncbi:MAG: MATE family efflux transporter [Treponema sp.]|nr:MATE family efflux transporter [Treponema sp.]